MAETDNLLFFSIIGNLECVCCSTLISSPLIHVTNLEFLSAVMIAETVSLGVLSLPATVAEVGLIP